MITKNKKASKYSWFTLIELIVVITILAILGSIAFVNYNGYSSSARDSARASDLSNISKALSVYEVNNGSLPLPNDYTNVIDASWSLLYQWLMWDSVLSLLWVTKWVKDPLDWNRYSYSVSADKSSYQVGNYMENSNSVAMLDWGIWWGVENIYALDYAKRYFNTKWDSIGIILDDVTNAPIYSWAVIEWVSYTWELNLSGNVKSYRVRISNKSDWSLSGTGGDVGKYFKNIDSPYMESVSWIPWLSFTWKTTDYELSVANSVGSIKILPIFENPKITCKITTNDINVSCTSNIRTSIISIKAWLNIIYIESYSTISWKYLKYTFKITRLP